MLSASVIPHRVPRVLIVVVAAYVACYVVWHLAAWGDAGTRAVIAYAALVVPGAVTVASCWSATRRCGDEPRVASGWRWLAAAFALLTVAFALTTVYQWVDGVVPFPSAVDGFYVVFYVVFLIGLLRFPTRRESGSGTLRLSLDIAIVTLSSASVVWFLVLGPTVTASGQRLVTGLISGSYPVGDLLSIFGLTYIATRGLTPSARGPLRVLASGIVLTCGADVLLGWLLLHGHPGATGVVQVLWMVAFGFYVIAAASQGPANAEPDRISAETARSADRGPAALLPYLAPLVVFGLLIAEQRHGSFFDRMSLAIGAVVVGALVLLRQAFARHDLLSAQAQLSHQALHDGLTGLPNRALVLDRAERMLARARRQGWPSAALFIDLDGFKAVNDTFGHAAGDELLVAVAARLSLLVREADTVGRLGGDEFVVLLDTIAPHSSAELVAERILDVVRQPVQLAGVDRAVSVGVSIGVAVSEHSSADALLRDADLALYSAKGSGKDRYVLFEPEMQAAAEEQLRLDLDLREALAGEQLFLQYQPIFDLQAHKMIGVEALSRWRHPTRGVIEPEVFIPIAEESGLIVDIGRWVLDTACEQAAAWHAAGHRVGMSINVSARQLDNADLVDDVRIALETHGLDPATITLELTESALMRDADAAAARLAELKALGVRIAIDDFGTGYSSLSYLRRFAVDAIKIDRAFISGIVATPRESEALVHTLVQLAKTLGLETVGEGIEEHGQLAWLQTERCDHGQGFLYSRPADAESIDALLAAESVTPQA